MPEWLESSFGASEGNLEPWLLVTKLSIAFVLGCVVAGIYRWTHGAPNSRSMSLMATLVLLTILIGMVTLVIGNSVARAFSLVGALSIVRFRTVVEDTRDTAFVIFAVAVGMSSGAGYFVVPIIGIPLVALAASLFRPSETVTFRGSKDCMLAVRLGLGRDPRDLLRPVFEKHLQRWKLTTTSTIKQGSAIATTFIVRLRSEESMVPLVTELNSLDGVYDVDVRQS